MFTVRVMIFRVCLVALVLGAGAWPQETFAQESPTPSPTSMPLPTLTHQEGGVSQSIDWVYRWSISWHEEFWISPLALPGLFFMESQPLIDEDVFSLSIYVLSRPEDPQGESDQVDLSGYSFEDTRECLDFESQQFAGQPWFAPIEVREGPDGSPMTSRTPDRTWAITQRVEGNDDVVEYIECRVLDPGSSYLFISAWTPSEEAFAYLEPELKWVLDSIIPPVSEATPSAAD